MTIYIETRSTEKKWTREFPSWRAALEWMERVLPVWFEEEQDEIEVTDRRGHRAVCTINGVTEI